MLPEHLAWQYPVLRIVIDRVASLEEVKRSWTIEQVLDMNDMFDLREEADLNAAERQRDQAEAAASRR